MKRFKQFIINNNLGQYYESKSFKDITTLGIGGNIKLLFYPNSTEGLLLFYNYYLENKICPLFIIGNGSNVLASNNNYEGIVISLKKINYYTINTNNDILNVSCGYMIKKLVYELAKIDYGGLEFLATIPATIGGLIAMNAGAYGKETKDVLIDVLCIYNNKICIFKKEDLVFKYRYSNIINNLILLEARIKLEKKPKKQILEEVHSKNQERKLKQPLNLKNGGCTFKNSNNVSAWKIIDKLGYRGYEYKGVKVSDIHSNFIVNSKNASGEDMYIVINKIKKEAKEKFNVDLECEWIIINFFNN